MEINNKVLTYIGFSVKSRKMIYGINQIEKARDKCLLLLVCASASENTKKQATDYAKRKTVKVFEITEPPLESAVNKTNCKVAAITDENLANAILHSADGYLTDLLGRES